MLLALGYKAYAVIGAGHVWVEAQAENGLWYLLESCYGTVVSRSAERPDYYDPTIYITPDGCYEGNPTDDFPTFRPEESTRFRSPRLINR